MKKNVSLFDFIGSTMGHFGGYEGCAGVRQSVHHGSEPWTIIFAFMPQPLAAPAFNCPRVWMMLCSLPFIQDIGLNI